METNPRTNNDGRRGNELSGRQQREKEKRRQTDGSITTGEEGSEPIQLILAVTPPRTILSPLPPPLPLPLLVLLVLVMVMLVLLPH